MKRLLTIASALFIASSASAYSIQAAIVPDAGEKHVLVSIRDRACDSKTGNAQISTATTTSNGCWTKDGQLIKVTLLDSNEVKVFPVSEFKLIGDTQELAEKSNEKRASVTLTCVADAWVGDVTVERNADGSLKNVYVSGERVSASEQANALNFSYNGFNISLSTLTGVFNYETTGFQSFLNLKLGKPNAKGAGACKINTAQKKF